MKKNLVEKFFGRVIFLVENFLLQNHFLGYSLDEKKSWSINFLVENFFWKKTFLLQNHFLGNSLDGKKFGRKFFWSKIFCCKIISSDTVWMKKILVEKPFSENCFWSKIFLLQNHCFRNSLDEKMFGRNIFFFAISFPRNQFG